MDLLQKSAILAAGILIGWLLRWKRDKKYFDAVLMELNSMKRVLKQMFDEAEL